MIPGRRTWPEGRDAESVARGRARRRVDRAPEGASLDCRSKGDEHDEHERPGHFLEGDGVGVGVIVVATQRQGHRAPKVMFGSRRLPVVWTQIVGAVRVTHS